MDETRLKRVVFRAWRRGFREADLIFGPFAETHGPSLGSADLDDLEVLLDQPDQDVYDWITERTATPAEFETPVLQQLRDFKRSLPIASGDLSGS
jgi:antitoxin CptB